MSAGRLSGTFPFILISLGVALAIVLGGCRSRKVTTSTEPAASVSPSVEASHSHQLSEVRFPRRLLFIHVSNYAFMNSLTGSAEGGDRTKAAALRLAQDLRVPTQNGSQVVLLSDTAPMPDTKTATHDAIMEAYERFFALSGPNDRIVVYFGGHAVEIDGKVYLAPMEGTLNRPQSLIPLDDFYARLKVCRAVQKIVIWDVCRYNSERGRKFPGSEPMTASLSKALTAAPTGVEVITTCQPGENALEFNSLSLDPSASTAHYRGSCFLESIPPRNENPPRQGPADPIPLADWAASVGKQVAQVAASPRVRAKQTIRYHSGRPTGPGEPKSSNAPTSSPTVSPTVSSEVKAIVAEFRVPPISSAQTVMELQEGQYPAPAIALYSPTVPVDEIRKDKQKYPFENATLDALQAVRDLWVFRAKGGLQRRETIAAPVAETLKKEIKKELDAWAIGIEKLKLNEQSLEKVAALKKDRPLRWQAHYDYARAVVKARLAYMYEYDKLMGDVITQTLPPLEEKRQQNGYRLTPAEKMKSKKDVQALASEAAEIFTAIAKDHKHTPWELQAKQELLVPLGLVWEPTSIKK